MRDVLNRTAVTLTLSSPAYTARIVDLMGLAYANAAVSPMATNLKLEPCTNTDDEPNYPYATAIGCLMWLATTVRPEIAFATNLLATFIHNFDTAHITAVKRVFHWLKSTKDLGITYHHDAFKH